MHFLRNLRVKHKLLLIISIGILLAVMIASLSYKQSHTMTKNIEAIYEEKFIPNDWLSHAISVNLRINSIIVEIIKAPSQSERDALSNELNNGVDEVLNELDQYEKMELTDEEREGLASFYDAVERLSGKQDEVIRLALIGESEKAYALFKDGVQESREDLISSLEYLQQFKFDQTEQIVAESVASANANNRNNIIINVIGILILVLLGITISRMVTKPLTQLREQLEKVQNGDFTVKGSYQSNDEIGQLTQSFNHTFDSLRTVLEKVKQSSDHVDHTSQELMANVSQSTSAAEHVVASIQEISSGAEQTQYRLEKNAIVIDRIALGFSAIQQNIKAVDSIASSAIREANDGSSIVSQNVNQMKNIKNSIQQSNSVVQTLANQVGEVDEILKVIENISQQTNLLALNAAIEAARAGDHGKGFAVVADEVRKLAEQSMEATKSVGQILSNIKQDTADSVQIMNVVINEANDGLEITETTAKKFQDILTNTAEIAPVLNETTDSVQNIVGDFDTFKDSADTILSIAINNSKNSEMVSASSEQQAAAMDDMHQSSQSLANVAAELNDVVKKFTL